MEGYNIQFRHVEFCGALSAVMQQTPDSNFPIRFRNALSYNGTQIPEIKLAAYNEAMQYVDISDDSSDVQPLLPIDTLIATSERCSLIHALYQIVAEGDTYTELASLAISNGGFDDMMVGGIHENDTWCFRARNYGEISGDPKEKRYSSRARSMKLEKEGLNALKPLLIKFGGSVRLDKPDCKIYIFDGLEGGKKVLAKRLTVGPKVRKIVVLICFVHNLQLQYLTYFTIVDDFPYRPPP